MSAHPILNFWFGPIGDDGSVAPEVQKRWWTKSPEFDGLCRSKFEGEVQAARAGEREALKESARGCLAFVLLCDQIPRNIYRDSPLAFASDGIALATTLHMLDTKLDQSLVPVEKSFAYMPLMHAEDRDIQLLSLERFTELEKEGLDNLRFAESHKAIIDRFGRYPHRNTILGRASTPEELAFLEQPARAFSNSPRVARAGTGTRRDEMPADADPSAPDGSVSAADARVGPDAMPNLDMSFFATSTGSGASGGNLGGLAGADAKCQNLASNAGAGTRTWHAYLSTGPTGPGAHRRRTRSHRQRSPCSGPED